jgi:hypothetical protein
MATWRLRRLYHMESGFLSVGAIDMKLIFDHYKNPGPSERLAIVCDRDTLGQNTLAKLSRFESRLERSFYHAIHELQRLRAQRAKEEVGRKAETEEVTNQTQFHSPAKPFNGMPCSTGPAPTAPQPVAPI